MKNFSKTFIYALLIFVLLSGTYALIQGEFKSPKQVALSELVADINAGRVEKITVEEDTLAIRMKDGSEVTSRKEAEAGLSQVQTRRRLKLGVSHTRQTRWDG